MSKSASLDPFNFSQSAGTQHFLKETFKWTDGQSDLTRYAGRYPGSWTLPVCHASTWGKSCNWDYANGGYEKSPITHPPCICGMLLPLYCFRRETGKLDQLAIWLTCDQGRKDSKNMIRHWQLARTVSKFSGIAVTPYFRILVLIGLTASTLCITQPMRETTPSLSGNPD